MLAKIYNNYNFGYGNKCLKNTWTFVKKTKNSRFALDSTIFQLFSKKKKQYFNFKKVKFITFHHFLMQYYYLYPLNPKGTL